MSGVGENESDEEAVGFVVYKRQMEIVVYNEWVDSGRTARFVPTKGSDLSDDRFGRFVGAVCGIFALDVPQLRAKNAETWPFFSEVRNRCG